MMLLQKAMPVQEITPIENFTLGSKIISGLLSLIGVLMWYIWNTTRNEGKERHQEQKMLAEKRHQDTMRLFEKMDERQDSLENFQLEQGYQIFTLNGVINLSQGKDFNYNNPPPKKGHPKP